MKCRRRLIWISSCFLMLVALSFPVYAMDFDAETAYESIFVVSSGKYEGSGFAIGTNTVVTNAHVIDDSDEIVLYTYGGDTYRASIYIIDHAFDIAILSVKNAEFVPLETGDNESLKVGDDIYAIGAPKSMGYTLTKGVVSNKERKIGAYSYIQIDAAINSGNSGGPLLNNKGQVVGVNAMKISDAEGIGLAIPMASVVSFIENNGMTMTDDNVIDGEIPFMDDPQKNISPDTDDIDIYRSTSSSPLNWILGIALMISVTLNVILIVMLAYRRNKNVERIPDASERTDFDIDILE